MCDLPVLKNFCRESYSPPESVYRQLKHLGMNLVTVTDHDSIEASEHLWQYPDFFISEEVTCGMPGGREMHVGAYDITERQHIEIQVRRNDLPRLLSYLEERDIFFSVNHIFSSMTGRRELEDFEWLNEFPLALEILNGSVPCANNFEASLLAMRNGRPGIAGSDAHTIRSLGSAYTEVPEARDKSEYFSGLRLGRGRVWGQPGNYWTLTRDLLLIAGRMIEESPAKLVLAPLVCAIPFVALAFQIREAIFAGKWARELARAECGRQRPIFSETNLESEVTVA